MRKVATMVLLAGLVVLASGCGEDEDGEATTATPAAEEQAAGEGAEAGEHEAAVKEEGPAANEDDAAKGTTVVLSDSEFGEMIYDADDQAIYVFERDRSEESTCYGECATAWPPVITSGDPIAESGADSSLLGTTERRDGSLQVTYAGRPLYYYAHEGPGEVRCHNVDLNGGFWWVVGADGEPLA
jgi:predicted lipoprotein with Yx(FWY)xxD motif